MSDPAQQVRVGVGVFVLQHTNCSLSANPNFLIGQRKGSHGAGTFALPGGHLEFGETFEKCGAREVLEETGLRVKDITFLTATNNVMEADGRHYVTIFMVCTREDETVEAERLEPEKCEGWDWISWEDMVQWAGLEDNSRGRLFLPLLNLVEQRPHIIPGITQ